MEPSLSKIECAEELNQLYVLGESLEEEEIMVGHPEFYAKSIGIYGDWKRVIKEHGVRRHKILEQEKFLLYWMMKRRFELYGDEAIRHINIQPPKLKERVTSAFKTVKALRKHFYSWNEERVLYEIRMHLLTGGAIEKLKTENHQLYQASKTFFKGMDELRESYEDAFGIASVQGELPDGKTGPQISTTSSNIEEILIDFLKELDYFKEMGSKADIVDHIISAKEISKNGVVDYLFEQWALARKEGRVFREDDMKIENPIMYYAFKQYFSSMREAFQELLSKVQ